MADYAAVHALVANLIAEGVEASVPTSIRETVRAVCRAADAKGGTGYSVTVTEVAQQLKIDKSSASRRVQNALAAGYLRNHEIRKGQPAQLVPGDRLPIDAAILPTP